MFDSNEQKAFRGALSGIVRVFVVLVALFVSGEFVLNRAFTNHFSSGDSVTIENRVESGLASAASVLASTESKGSFLAKIIKEPDETLAASPPPSVSAGSYIVANLDSGRVYAEKNPDEVKSIASITKLVTALTASGSLATDPIIEVMPSANNTRGNMAYFTVGEKMALSDMFYPLLLSSANDAALVISGYYGDDSFGVLMNKQAQRIGMNSSFFVEPSGLSGENRSTVRDLLVMSQHIHENKRFIFDITEIEEKNS
jgi:D-alanyl-D-alanine carboxypeptidase